MNTSIGLPPEQIQALLARYDRGPARRLVLLPSEPPFGTRRLVQVDADRIRDEDVPPAGHAREAMAFYDEAEAMRVSLVPSDVEMLCEMALRLHRRVSEAEARIDGSEPTE